MFIFLNFAEAAADTDGYGAIFYSVPVGLAAIYAVLFILCIFIKPLRYLDKWCTAPITAALFAFWLSVYICASGTFGRSERLAGSLSVFIFGLNFILSALLRRQSQAKIRLTARDKRLIGKLSANNREVKQISDNPFKRVERLDAFTDTDKKDECEPNFNEIKSIIEKLRRHELTVSEEDELDKTEMDIEKLSERSPSPYERRQLSDRLLKIVKMMAKYNI